MKNRIIYFLSLLFILILGSCTANNNKSNFKVLTHYAVQGNDTIASYIRVESDTVLNYVIIKKDILRYSRYDKASKKKLDSLMNVLGVSPYFKMKYEMNSYDQDSCFIFLDDNILNNYRAYDHNYYYLLGKYDDWDNQIKYSERPLKKAKEKQLTSKNRPIEIHAIAGYWGADYCYISSDTILTIEEMRELIDKNHLEHYHDVHFEIICIGLNQEYAKSKDGLISYIPKYPRSKKEADIRGIKDYFEFWKKDLEVLSSYNLNVIRKSIEKLNEAYRMGEDFYKEHKNEHPNVEKEFKSFKKFMIKKQQYHFPYFRSGYAIFANEEGWDSDIEVTTIGEGNKTIVFTSYLFSRSQNIDDVYKGLKDVLKELRFTWAEFRVSKYGRSRREWIGGEEDDAFN